MFQFFATVALLALSVLAFPSLAAAADAAGAWGDLSLRIVYDSDKLPVPKPVEGAAGVMFCGGLAGLKTDDLVVNPKDRGVANVFVYLFEESGKVPIHPVYAKTAKQDAVMANRGCAFVPKALTMRLSQTFVGTNPDPVGHNMKLDSFDNISFNLAVPSGGKITNTFKVAEQTPLEVRCTSHTWMAGLVLVRDDPYAAVTDESGRARLANLPVGQWKFRVWHQRRGYLKQATLAGKPLEWKSNRIEWEIKPGKNDLGDVLAKPAAFRE